MRCENIRVEWLRVTAGSDLFIDVVCYHRWVFESGLVIAGDECTSKIGGGTKTKTITDAFWNIHKLVEMTSSC
jgi:hypothetical protein